MLYKHINDNLLQKAIDLVGGCNIVSGPWIIGGAARRLWFDEEWINHDIDFFFPDAPTYTLAYNQLQAVVERHTNSIDRPIFDFQNSINSWFVKQSSNPEVYVTHNASLFNFKNENKSLSIQIIKKDFFNNLEEAWNKFDFTVCKFATDGKTVVADPTALEHCLQKKLIKNPTSTQKLYARRVIKYSLYGFNADNEIIRELLHQQNEKTINDYGDDDY